jgi:hypothetical protein
MQVAYVCTCLFAPVLKYECSGYRLALALTLYPVRTTDQVTCATQEPSAA